MPKPLESITAARKAANACRHFMWGTTLTEGDLESKLIPLIRRELAKKEPANYWTVTISDNAGWTLQDIADKAFGIIASKGIDLEGKGAVVAMKDSVLEPGSALVECERVERDDEVAKLVNRACARRWGLARGANHPLVPLTLDVEGLPEPVPTTANLIVGRRNEGTQPVTGRSAFLSMDSMSQGTMASSSIAKEAGIFETWVQRTAPGSMEKKSAIPRSRYRRGQSSCSHRAFAS